MKIPRRKGINRLLRGGRGVLLRWQRGAREIRMRAIYRKYHDFTLVPKRKAIANLLLCLEQAPPTGCIVECGVWRGGMSAALADVLRGRVFYLFDSFEGMPPPRDIDGKAALDFQRDENAKSVLRVDQTFAEKAMRMSSAKTFHLTKGWFKETLGGLKLPEPIAVLRLDGDWYDSTIECLNNLYPQVMPGGLIILDDYFTFEGCSRAVHDYLSKYQTGDRIYQFFGVPYLKKPISG